MPFFGPLLEELLDELLFDVLPGDQEPGVRVVERKLESGEHRGVLGLGSGEDNGHLVRVLDQVVVGLRLALLQRHGVLELLLHRDELPSLPLTVFILLVLHCYVAYCPVDVSFKSSE